MKERQLENGRITEHSIERAMERIGLERDAAERFLLNGMVRGKSGEFYSGKEKRFLETHAKGECLSSIAYNGYCLVMSDDQVCLTVYALPEWFGKKEYYDHKERIRNAKKFMKFGGRLCNLSFLDPKGV